MNKLFSFNLGGNAHDAARYINERLPEFVDGVVYIETSGFNSTVIIRGSEEQIATAKKERRL